MNMILASRVQARLDYDPITGQFAWSDHPDNKFPGKLTGTVSVQGYKVISYGGTQLRCSRVAWACMTGEWPSIDVDHIDGDTLNDSWSNLRLATKSENMRNTKLREDNQTGCRGVSWAFRLGKWHVRINVNRQFHHVGYFDNFADAKLARDKAAERLHGAFARFDNPQTSTVTS